MQLNVSFAGTDTVVIEVIGAKAEEINVAVLDEMNALDAEISGWIVSEELSGQVLNQRLGVLAGTIRMIPARQEGTMITGEVEGGGGPTGIHTSHGDSSYANLFEYGKTVDIVPIPENHKDPNNAWLRFQTIEGNIVFAKKVHLELPRPFMAPAQLHFIPIIDERLEARIGAVLAK